jgi:hypothetical protein
MKMARKLIWLSAATVLATSPVGVFAQESLGNEFADKAAAELKAKNADAQVACSIKGDFVVCSGARIGDCLSNGWLVNHDGSECRKKLE